MFSSASCRVAGGWRLASCRCPTAGYRPTARYRRRLDYKPTAVIAAMVPPAIGKSRPFPRRAGPNFTTHHITNSDFAGAQRSCRSAMRVQLIQAEWNLDTICSCFITEHMLSFKQPIKKSAHLSKSVCRSETRRVDSLIKGEAGFARREPSFRNRVYAMAFGGALPRHGGKRFLRNMQRSRFDLARRRRAVSGFVLNGPVFLRLR